MNAPDIQDNERLGRRLSEKHPKYYKILQRRLKEKQAHPCPAQIFKAKLGETGISVDRLDLAPAEEIADIAEKIAREDNRFFYGWGVVVYHFLLENFKACKSPDAINKYHADLYFIDPDSEEKDLRANFASILADQATWLPRPQ